MPRLQMRSKRSVTSNYRSRLFSLIFLDAIASVGLHMSVCLSVSLFDFDDGTSVSKGIAAYGAILSCSLVN